MTTTRTPAVGTPLSRLDGPAKVRGAVPYAYEHQVTNPAYLALVLSSVTRGTVTAVDDAAALAEAGVLAVLTHANAMRLADDDPELAVLQSADVRWRWQIVAAVVAESSEIARHAASLVRVSYDEAPHDTEMRTDGELEKPGDHVGLFGTAEGELNNGMPDADTEVGDVEAALARAAVTVDATYTTPHAFQHPMEPHAAIAQWTAPDQVTIHCGSQGVSDARRWIAGTLGLPPEHIRLISPHVGGGFGAKTFPQSYAVVTAMAAKTVGRPVKLALTRQQMFVLTGYRAPSSHRMRLGADRDGRLTAIAHDSVQQTARAKKYAEQVAVVSRTMWAAPHRRTTHRLVPLDVPVPTIMRGPGEAQGSFALESAMDEMAAELGLDPVEFRVRNEPDGHPESGRPFSSRRLIECLREGARIIGWDRRDPTPRSRREDGWLVGTGVAAGSYPSPQLPGNATRIQAAADGRHTVSIAAADIGTGTWTTLTQIAADALDVEIDAVTLRIGETGLPAATSAGFSSGTSSWGGSIDAAARELRRLVDEEHGGSIPSQGLDITVTAPVNPYASRYEMYSFGAQFAEVRIHEQTGTPRVSRLVGVFDVGRVINPKTARSQLTGGMIQGISMALHENGVMDPRHGQIVNHDFAGYHIAANADIGSVEAHWIGTPDSYTNSLGSKGLGEVCVIGTAAAVANAVHHATGVRVRDLPITLDKLLRR
ncbi:xanthine dehydrogenase family protein molybdopterin-binding subunit [Yinghuangia sp. ASG 101]|uniref:xanthine dehydrogenase family protein molybdopterin-binding subunit n=1 Tax=Yinghuangia sp. ASG 101 TaxID=2896848 RepID=UPI001E4CAD93|nr:xanthine dehydrogenase family protein molybdopterin-binding subunit [Yinghuangia sp. ASG 101]UGQ08947.1 xanthine dehydrogenase family protein molybdopterin-binding subunit [Yinghuangia sp. ASG 101]